MVDQTVLARFGFPNVHAFQQAFCGGVGDLPLLTVDGVWGPHTASAAAELPHLSPHFRVDTDNLRSKGNGQCLVRRELLYALELLRGRLNRPVPIIDAYRDPAYNAKLSGAAADSQHCQGLAADVPDSLGLTVQACRDMHIFSGIGYSRSTGHVHHVDMRHVNQPTNSTGSSPTNPAMWLYA